MEHAARPSTLIKRELEPIARPALPARYWVMVDFHLMTIDQAKEAWAYEQQQTGAEFDPLG